MRDYINDNFDTGGLTPAINFALCIFGVTASLVTILWSALV